MGTGRAPRIALGALVAGLTCASPAGASTAAMVFGPNDVPTVFFISKSDDRNRVDYGLRLDASCVPVDDDAVIVYWREFEKAPPVRTHPLSLLEYVPYGVAEQHRVQRTPTGAEYALRLKQLDRRIVILTRREQDGSCSATATTVVKGTRAQLVSVYAKLAGVMSVEYIDIHGKDLETGAPLSERIKR